ncbi:MAG TPA: hypothetical protein V6D19_01675 [Stenomitos sp.]
MMYSWRLLCVALGMAPSVVERDAIAVNGLYNSGFLGEPMQLIRYTVMSLGIG